MSATRTSTSQFEIMLHYLKHYPQMFNTKFNDEFSREMKNQRWEELTAILNGEGNGPAKTVFLWRKTFKDWKCYVKKKASKIAMHQAISDGETPSKEKLTKIERKLLATLGEDANLGQTFKLEGSEEETEDIYPLDDESPYYAKRKPAKRRRRMSPVPPVDVPERITHFRNENRRKMSEKKMALIEQQVANLERRAIAAERKAAAEEQSVLLKEKSLRQQWKNQMYILRMKKLEFL